MGDFNHNYHNQGITTTNNDDIDFDWLRENIDGNNVDFDFEEPVPLSSFNGDYLYNYSATATTTAMVVSDSQCYHTTSHQNFPVLDVEAAKRNEGPRLGLKLTATPSFVNLCAQLLETPNNPQEASDSTATLSPFQLNDQHGDFTSPDKLKALNFPALTLRIGDWMWESKHEGDLVVKLYFKKKKLVWEALDDNLKIKFEIKFSDISAIAKSSFKGHGILNVMLNKSPSFFREVNPQPKKHTNWVKCEDFTSNQASLHRRHTLEFAPGILEKHYDKIIQANNKLYCLSKESFPRDTSFLFKKTESQPTFPIQGNINSSHPFVTRPTFIRDPFLDQGQLRSQSHSQVTTSSHPTHFEVANNVNNTIVHIEPSNNHALSQNYNVNIPMILPRENMTLQPSSYYSFDQRGHS